MARARVTATEHRSVLWLAWLLVSGCNGVGLEKPASDAPDEQEHADERTPRDEPRVVEPPAPSAQPPDGDPDGVCRAMVRRGDEIVLAFADGEERLIDRNAMWQRIHGQVWALGEHAIVGVPEAEDFAHPPFAAFALVHASNGVVWRGTAPTSAYTQTIGFRSFTREGYVLVNDSRVIDPTGAEHAPIDGFAPVVDSIDEDGFILVGRDGELAYWNVRADRLDVSATAGVGAPITEVVQLGGLHGHESAFVEEDASGGLSFTRLSRSGVVRAPLRTELADRLRQQLLAPDEGYPPVTMQQTGAGALLVVDRRPMAWAGATATPHTFAEWSTLPTSHATQSGGGCFAGTPVGVTSAEELIAGLWRVHADTGALEMGLRFAIPSGFSLVVSDPASPWYASPAMICAGEGRMAVMLSGPDGFAWFSEGDTAFEQLTPWGEQTSYYPNDELSQVPEVPRIMGQYEYWYPKPTMHECELGYDDTGSGLLMIDRARGLELPLAPDANAALLER